MNTQSRPTPVLISCDEAGFTGAMLLDENQPIFTYAAVDLSSVEVEAIIKDVRSRRTIQAPELKAKGLRKRGDWLRIAAEVMEAAEGRTMVIAFDKRLNLAGKTFEYVFEPVLEANNMLFYDMNLHRFVMNTLHQAMVASGQTYEVLARELQAFMRTFEPGDAPNLFNPGVVGSDLPLVLSCLVRFARGYAARIERSTQHLRAEESAIGKWALDLTSTALFGLIVQGWGLRHERIEVLCDESKPLAAFADMFDNFVDRDEAVEMRGAAGATLSIRANLARPLMFGSSLDNPTLQVADVLAGITSEVIKGAVSADRVDLIGWVDRHLHQNHVLPDPHWSDATAPDFRMNLAALQELARRADLGLDPLDGMSMFYRRTITTLAAERRRGPIA